MFLKVTCDTQMHGHVRSTCTTAISGSANNQPPVVLIVKMNI